VTETAQHEQQPSPAPPRDDGPPAGSITQELSPPPPLGDLPPAINPVVVPRWVQLVVLPLALVALVELARAAKTGLLLFLIASVIALMLNPLVSLIHRAKVPRGVAVALVYVAFFAGIAGLGLLLANPVANQISSLQKNVPHLVDQANKRLDGFQQFLNRNGINIKIESQGQTALQTLQNKLLKGSGSLVSFTGNLLTKVATTAFDLFLIFVISIYLLIYGESIGRIARRVLPAGDGSAADDLPLRAQRAVFAYVRGQLLFSLTMGTSVGVALWIYGTVGIFPDGAHYAVAFGAFYAVMELIPYVGAVLGAVPPVAVALFEHPLTAVWVTVLFIVLQQVEGHIVAPNIFGKSLRLNPLVVILALLLGDEIYGIIGALLALPIAAILRETIVYLRRHLVLEPWNTPTATQIASGRAGLADGAGDGAPTQVPPAVESPASEAEGQRDDAAPPDSAD
jgi:predicted PurR-regulated permease PerM